MAPEVLQGQGYTEKTDVYSAGVIYYQMLTGKYPFFIENVEETWKLVRLIKKGADLSFP